ncbi:MAG: NAD(P)-dependent alcohol dehydrogenase [Phenylobacterium sp.]
MAMMKAAVYRRYGPPEVVRVEAVPKPSPKAGEVLVRVHAATVCAADWRCRKAEPFIVRLMNGLFAPKRMRVLGLELSGTVEAVGAGVTRFAPGDEVFGSPGMGAGAHAQYVCLAEDGLIAKRPPNMSLDEAACVIFGGSSALHFLRAAKVQPGQKVLIYGASGSVGVFAVQIAKHMGAHVTAVCSTRNVETARSRGADAVVDYTRQDFAAAGPVYDVIFETVGKADVRRAFAALKPGGTFVVETPAEWLQAIGLALMPGRARVVGGMARVTPDGLAYLKDLIEAGKLRTVIDRSFPLDQIAEAHRLAESGHKRGHVAVLMD